MSCVNADYSNTIFYKIFCKDPSIKDLYIGHTTNFVQRKHAHKQSCINPKLESYKCKLYKCIRDNLGWDNWRMEIIGFHNCEDLHSAKVQEQLYFEEYKATLNSVEPLPKRKPKKKISIKLPKLYCDVCNIYFNTRTSQEEHNERLRHVKMTQSETINNTSFCKDTIKIDSEISYKYSCKKCNYNTSRKSQYDRHIMTTKHLMQTNSIVPKTSKCYTCKCNKQFKHASSLWNHKQKCTFNETDETHINVPDKSIQSLDSILILELLKQNRELHEIIIEFAKNDVNTTK
jgi:hypothetical protein